MGLVMTARQRMQVVEATLSGEVYEHEEDFFFRTVHLGTECWAFVVQNRIAIAQQCAEEGQWNIAAARTIQANIRTALLSTCLLPAWSTAAWLSTVLLSVATKQVLAASCELIRCAT